ncbi:MAG: hypothetical protein RI885_2156 [Actinomycetota bacterium]|jgi:alkanesulfonate monooxygenase SsuD/methylene tetrahydromethanopterin reductase-like flavin-dependent oxidoreductase (luciferase family)
MTRIGVTVPRDIPIGDLIPFARRAEQLGFDELWTIEDCFFRGGFSQTATVLAVTTTIHVGIGIVPAAVRNAAFTALETATLAELHPGRVTLGIGHGVTDWMKQVGVWPASPLTMLSETLSSVRGLLRGDTVSVDGRYVSLDDVVLESAPSVVPDVLAGVRGPKSLEVASRLADGVVLAEPVTPEYLAAVRSLVGQDARIVAYDFAMIDDDRHAAVERLRPSMASMGERDLAAHIDPLPFADELRALRASSTDAADFARRMPSEWIERLAIVGTPGDAAARVAELADAGAQSVVLLPIGHAMTALEGFGRVLAQL